MFTWKFHWIWSVSLFVWIFNPLINICEILRRWSPIAWKMFFKWVAQSWTTYNRCILDQEHVGRALQRVDVPGTPLGLIEGVTGIYIYIDVFKIDVFLCQQKRSPNRGVLQCEEVFKCTLPQTNHWNLWRWLSRWYWVVKIIDPRVHLHGFDRSGIASFLGSAHRALSEAKRVSWRFFAVGGTVRTQWEFMSRAVIKSHG